MNQHKYTVLGALSALTQITGGHLWVNLSPKIWEGLAMGFAGALGGYLFTLIRKAVGRIRDGPERHRE
ncbi:hypothetical protein FUAX_43650 (plasmid) [Fulvitalea axinellae]|uniref:Holin n=1 Tax=Fulvitalea axinellae TaxID=1182444 RepID=A0AAU9D7E7_9BACT|nr:hypothetical protein FUAX_43650 [Fulvitalea axinellae]